MEKHPLYIDGEEKGSIKIYKDGLLTFFDAECSDVGKIVKLYVFGEGKSAYIGTMEPSGNRLHIIKKYSRSAIQMLPERIEYAANEILNRELKTEKAGDDSILWYQSQNGCLTAYDGNISLLALPADRIHNVNDRMKLRMINGRKYLVFRGKRI